MEISESDVLAAEMSRLDSRITDTKGEVCDILNAHFGRSLAQESNLFATSETERKVQSLQRRAQELAEAVEGVGADLTEGLRAKEVARDALAKKLGDSRAALEITEQLLVVHAHIMECDRCVESKHTLDAVDAIESAQQRLDAINGAAGQEQSPLNGDSVADSTAVRLLRREIRRRETDLITTLGVLWQSVVVVPTLDATSFARRSGAEGEESEEEEEEEEFGTIAERCRGAAEAWSVPLIKVSALNRDASAFRASDGSASALAGGAASEQLLLLPRLLRALQSLSAAAFRRHVERFARALVTRVVKPLLARANRSTAGVELKLVERAKGRVDLHAVCSTVQAALDDDESTDDDDVSMEVRGEAALRSLTLASLAPASSRLPSFLPADSARAATASHRIALLRIASHSPPPLCVSLRLSVAANVPQMFRQSISASPAQRIDPLEHSAAKAQTDLGAVLQLLRFVRAHILGSDDELALAVGREFFGKSVQARAGAGAGGGGSGSRMQKLRATSKAAAATSPDAAKRAASGGADLAELLLSQMQVLLPSGKCNAVVLRELGRELTQGATRFESEATAMSFGAAPDAGEFLVCHHTPTYQ